MGADACCRIRSIRSVCSTWRKQGRSVLDALTCAFARLRPPSPVTPQPLMTFDNQDR
jgi:hypothetical protein